MPKLALKKVVPVLPIATFWQDYRLFLTKISGFAVTLIIFLWASVSIHETFHFLVAKSLSVDTRIEIWWSGEGRIYFESSVTPIQHIIIAYAGGIGTALMFGVLWVFSHIQGKYSKWELDTTVIFFFLAIWQLVYAPFDGSKDTSLVASTGIAMTASLVITSLIYGKQLIKWFVSGVNKREWSVS